MSAFYTEKERKNALLQMHIDPGSERVSSAQAAKILTWRAREEYKIDHEYDANAVRKHADKLDAQPAMKSDGSVNLRQNTYNTKKLFEIDIMPARTNTGRKVS
jgi:hypothetical protein